MKLSKFPYSVNPHSSIGRNRLINGCYSGNIGPLHKCRTLSKNASLRLRAKGACEPSRRVMTPSIL